MKESSEPLRLSGCMAAAGTTLLSSLYITKENLSATLADLGWVVVSIGHDNKEHV